MGFARPSATAAGLLAGLAAVAVSVPSLKTARGEGSLGLDLRMSVLATGELAIGGDPLIVNARRLVPGSTHDAARGSTVLANQTGGPLTVHVATLPSSVQLSDQLMVELRAGGRRFARGTIAQLRSGARSFTIPYRGHRRLSVRAWLPASIKDGYRGALQDVSLELRSVAATKTKGPAA
jgi:hypothetical protein